MFQRFVITLLGTVILLSIAYSLAQGSVRSPFYTVPEGAHVIFLTSVVISSPVERRTARDIVSYYKELCTEFQGTLTLVAMSGKYKGKPVAGLAYSCWVLRKAGGEA